MLSLLNTIWTVLRTTFRKRATVQYPEERPHIPPRWRGRIILSRDAERTGALRGLQSLRCGLPGRLHLAPVCGG